MERDRPAPRDFPTWSKEELSLTAKPHPNVIFVSKVRFGVVCHTAIGKWVSTMEQNVKVRL